MKTIWKNVVVLKKLFGQDLPGGLGSERIKKISLFCSEVEKRFTLLADIENKTSKDLVASKNFQDFSAAMKPIWEEEIELPDIEPFSFKQLEGLRLNGFDNAALLEMGIIKE